MKLIAIGIISESCPTCSELKLRLQKAFDVKNIELEFVEYSYDLDPEGAVKEAMQFGLEEIPSFVIMDEIFTKNFQWEQIINVFKKIKCNSLQ